MNERVGGEIRGWQQSELRFSFFPACMVVFCRTRAPCEDSLWSLSEKWCKTVAEIDACLLRINSTNQQGNVSPFLCSSIQTISERFATAHSAQGEENSGGGKKKFFFVSHFSLATFYYQGLDKCKNKEQSFAVAQSQTTDNYSSKMMDIFFSANDSKRM